MIRHIVLVRPRADVAPEAWASLMGRLDSVVDALPGAMTFRSGSNVSPEAGMGKGYSEAFVVDFHDAAARDAYLVDPEHVRIGERLVQMAQDGPEGIVVVDLEIGS
ncbi:Dabb family protein [Nocardioides marinquilinus]|uniref:Dabb family protein n=1 Tax=Nocardioides marinquilinus TaxID=1210400 RepID=A0ABP9P8Z8_9ACTN